MAVTTVEIDKKLLSEAKGPGREHRAIGHRPSVA